MKRNNKIRLGDLIESVKFGRRPASDKRNVGSFPFVTIERNSKFFSETYDFDDDRIIIQVARHSNEIVPVVKFQSGKFGLSQNMIAVLFNKKICNQRFMYFLISEIIDEISETCFLNGTNLNIKKLKGIQINRLPSIDRQKELLAILEPIEKSKELASEGSYLLEELFETVIHNAFDSLKKETILLSNILDESNSGKVSDTSEYPVHSIQKNSIFSVNKKNNSKRAKKYKISNKDDIMYRPAGILESYINIISEDSLIPTIYNLLKLKDSKTDIKFLIYYLRSQHFLEIISSKVSQGVRTNMSNKRFLSLRVTKFPLLEEQKKISAFLDNLVIYKDSLKKEEEYYGELLESTMDSLIYK